MAKIKAYDDYLGMDKEDIILSYRGEITESLLSSIYELAESKIGNEDVKRKKKLFNILVECLQNLFHHSDVPENEASFFAIGRGKGNTFRVVTGNAISREKVEPLKTKMEKINSMKPEELKTFYQENLDSSEFSQKGGAGLGLIDIARKSGNKLEYNFQPVSDKHSFFTLSVTID